MNTAGLTARQAQALLFIAGAIETGGLSPTLREIGAHLGLKGKSGVHALLINLRDRGRITWQPRRTRSILIAAAGYTLPRGLQIALDCFCIANEERAGDVVADAVMLHLDALASAPAQRLEG